jgi:pyruvate/2-oxoglutarate dehydrogenase complex dihydrolipoamide acyltransferase (E2) component
MPSLLRLAQGTASALLIAALLGLLPTAGCDLAAAPATAPATTQTAAAPAPAPATSQTAAASAAPAPTKGGAQLWVENCRRCHQLRDPSTYNNRQWEVSMHAMRVRANLTAQEHRLILAFLQSP